MADPRKRILDRSFKYVRAAETDVSKTFARIRRQMKEAAEAEASRAANVKPIRKRGAL